MRRPATTCASNLRTMSGIREYSPGCAARATAIFADHPDHAVFYGDEPSMRDKPENIRRDASQCPRPLLRCSTTGIRKAME